MASSTVAFVLVPGSFATPILYEDNIVAGVRGKGYDIKAIELLSANDGSRQPPPKMEDDAAHIRAAVLAILDDEASPKDVVLTVHSYSGIPGSSALKGLSKADRAAEGKSTGVTGIVYMGSFVPLLGETVRGIMGETTPEPYKTGIPGGYLPPIQSELAALIFNDLSPEDALKLHSQMSTHSSDTYDGKASYEAWKDILTVQIIPEADLIVGTALQEEMYQKALAAGGKITRVLVKGAGHAINISQTDTVVDEMIKLARS